MILFCTVVFFFFKQKTAYEMRISDWSSDVCSSDLIRQDHDLFRRQNFRGFRHEADAAEGDDIRIGRLRLAGKVQAVAYEICEILDLWLLIIMSKDDSIPLLAQPVDFGAQVQPFKAPAHSATCVHSCLQMVPR